MLVWVAAVLVAITALLDRYTVLRVSDLALAVDIDWKSAAITVLPALIGVFLFGGCARVAAFSVIERFIDDTMIGATRRLLAADWRDVARNRPETKLGEISAGMREDARAVAAVAPAFAILAMTVAWLGLHTLLILLGILIVLPAGFLVIKKLTPPMLASGAVLAQAESDVDRVTGQMLTAGVSLHLQSAREPDFLAQSLFRPIDDATRAAIAYARSYARVAGAVAWISFVLVLIILSFLPASNIEDAWVLAIVLIVATLNPVRQVLAIWPAIQRLRGLPGQLDAIVQDNPPTENLTPMAPARWTSIGLQGVSVDPCDTPGLLIAGIGPVDMSLNAGMIVALTGPHAEDRATLLLLLCGLLPPDRGTVVLDGRPIPSATLRSLCGVALDSGTLAAFGVPSEISPRAAALYTRFDLMPGRAADSYTVTERTCLALIAMEVQDRPIRLYDERVAAVEPHYQKAFAETLREARERGRLCILATSDAPMIALADRVIRMVDGRIDVTSEVSR